MKWSELVPTIKDLWEAVSSPVLNLAIFVTAAYLICPPLVWELTEGTRSALGRALADPDAQKVLELIGVTKVAPIAFGILLIAVLIAFDRFLRFIGAALPGHVLFRQPSLFVQAASPHLDYFCLRHPNVEQVHDMLHVVRALVEDAQPSRRTLADAQRRRASYWGRLLVLAKAHALLIIALVLIAYVAIGRIPLVTSLLLLGACGGIGVFAFVHHLYREQQVAFAEAVVAKQQLLLTVPPDSPTREALMKARARADGWAREYRNEKWWQFQLVNCHWFKWVSNTILKTQFVER